MCDCKKHVLNSGRQPFNTVYAPVPQRSGLGRFTTSINLTGKYSEHVVIFHAGISILAIVLMMIIGAILIKQTPNG